MNWHRHFGLILSDLFTGSPFVVDLEKDLSLKKQLLDVVILRRRPGPLTLPLPDGLEDLAAHNLITFKSHQEALDAWAIKELIGHYVNYRKQASPSLQELLPEEQFHLYAVCARFPQTLAGQVPWSELRPGVYDCRWGTDRIRVLVPGRLAASEVNAVLHLFSAVPDLVGYGRAHYRPRSPDSSTLLYQLFEGYRQEGLPMPYTMEDFRRQFRQEFLENLTPEERTHLVYKLTPEEREQVWRTATSEERQDLLRTVTPEERRELLRTATPEERRSFLRSATSEERQEFLRSATSEERREFLRSATPEERREFLRTATAEERLEGLSREEIERYLHRKNGTSPPPA